MNKTKILNKIRDRRKNRTRARIHGTAETPRFSVFRSNHYTYVQLIDDKVRKTLISASTQEFTDKQSITKQKLAEKLGELIAKKAIEKGIKKAIFDKGNYKYHGRIKAIAEEARKGGLQL
ncbi:MAG: 50S ribosomal protein L18 [Patescibacteria group bacterium]